MTGELAASVPPEPAVGSVILDRHDLAVQRRDEGWSPCVGGLSLFGVQHWGWASMLIARGPVRLIWDGATGAPPAELADPEAQTTGGPGPKYTPTARERKG